LYASFQGSEDVLELGYDTRYMHEEAVLVNLVSQCHRCCVLRSKRTFDCLVPNAPFVLHGTQYISLRDTAFYLCMSLKVKTKDFHIRSCAIIQSYAFERSR
jgi:hypothetical protein